MIGPEVVAPDARLLPSLSRIRTFGTLGTTSSNTFLKTWPTFQSPALPSRSIARTRQWYPCCAPGRSVLLGRSFVGDSDVPVVGSLQQIFEPAAKSDEELTSISYLAAPGTASHENCGSANVVWSASSNRSARRGVVVLGHSQTNDATAERGPFRPPPSIGVTAQ